MMTPPDHEQISSKEITSDWCKIHFPRDLRGIPNLGPVSVSRTKTKVWDLRLIDIYMGHYSWSELDLVVIYYIATCI